MSSIYSLHRYLWSPRISARLTPYTVYVTDAFLESTKFTVKGSLPKSYDVSVIGISLVVVLCFMPCQWFKLSCKAEPQTMHVSSCILRNQTLCLLCACPQTPGVTPPWRWAQCIVILWIMICSPGLSPTLSAP